MKIEITIEEPDAQSACADAQSNALTILLKAIYTLEL